MKRAGQSTTIRVLVRAISTNPDCVTCDLAIVDLNPADVAARIALAKDCAARDRAFHELRLFDVGAVYFESFDDEPMLETLTTEQHAALDHDEFSIVPGDFDPRSHGAGDAIRTEADCLVGNADLGAVYWQCRDKYADSVTFETRSIPFAVIERLALADGGAS